MRCNWKTGNTDALMTTWERQASDNDYDNHYEQRRKNNGHTIRCIITGQFFRFSLLFYVPFIRLYFFSSLTIRCYRGAECTHTVFYTGRPRLLARCKDGPLTCCTLLACPSVRPFCRGDAYLHRLLRVVEFRTYWPPAKFNVTISRVCIFNQKHTTRSFSKRYPSIKTKIIKKNCLFFGLCKHLKCRKFVTAANVVFCWTVIIIAGGLIYVLMISHSDTSYFIVYNIVH